MALMDTSLKQIHSIMNDENAVLIYSGEFNQDIVKSMLSYTEGKLESSGIDDLVRKKIFNVMVEQLQNITKHQYTDEEKQVKVIEERKKMQQCEECAVRACQKRAMPCRLQCTLSTARCLRQPNQIRQYRYSTHRVR